VGDRERFNIAMRFQGPVDQLCTNYTSDPALAPADIIHLLVFGKTEEAANAASAQSTTLGAESSSRHRLPAKSPAGSRRRWASRTFRSIRS
jgi:hypothetical protein